MGLFRWPGIESASPGSTMPVPSGAPLRAGVYVRPWTETAATLNTLWDLRPGVVRINYPAFPLIRRTVPYGPGENERLVAVIEAQIAATIAHGAQPLIITSACLQERMTPEAVAFDAGTVAAFYANVAARIPGLWFECGNEVEIGVAGDEPLTPAVYARFFNIMAANASAKYCTAGVSGLSLARLSWLRGVLSLCTPDAIGVHPYGIQPRDYAARVRDINSNIPVWFTEYGTRDLGSQTANVRAYFTGARGVVPVAVWFALSDLSADGGETFGLLDSQGAPRASYAEAKAIFARGAA